MIVLVAAGGHSKVVADIILRTTNEKIVFFDIEPMDNTLYGCKVLSQMPKLQPQDRMIICIGNNIIRKNNVLELKGPFAKAIHPFSCMAGNAKIGEGSVVMAGAVINPFAAIGEHCIINTSASIDHDCEIHDFAHISPNATLCGEVIIGEGAHIGAGAVVNPGVSVGKWAVVGAGAVIINNVPDFTTVVGNPGRIIKN